MNESDLEKLDDRLRGAERAAAIMETNIQTLFHRLDDLKIQIGEFIARADLVMTCRQEIDSFAQSISDLKANIKSLTDWRTSHTNEYTTLISEHRLYCQAQKTQDSWWRDRAGKVLDWIIPALILYSILHFKQHLLGGNP